jgi:glycosyltransferase involved in cell wall biosynthesis
MVQSLCGAGHRVICIAPDEDFWPGGGAIDAIEATGAEYVNVPMDRGGTNPFADLLLMWRLRKVYKETRPDIVLHYTLKPVVFGSIVARLLKIPNVAIVTGQGSALVDTHSPLARLTRALLRFSLRRATCVFFLNPADHAEFVRRRIVPPATARVLPGEGIDTNHFAPTAGPPETPTFLMVARLLRDKGVYEYVEAARAVREIYPEARFLLGGALDSANPSGVSAAELAAWQDEGNIEYLGVVDDPRSWYAQASAVVLPSYREGMSRVLLEAISCGLPVLASDVPGCRELVEHGENGFLFPPRNAYALADHMKRFLKLSAETQADFGARGRALAVTKFDQDRVNRVYLEALPHLMQGRCPPP